LLHDPITHGLLEPQLVPFTTATTTQLPFSHA